MRGTLFVTGAAVVVGLSAGAWLLVAPGGPPPVAVEAAAGPAPDATPVAGSEVMAPTTSTQLPHDRLPDLAIVAPRVTLPLPASASAEGYPVDGFPGDLAGPLDASDILSTSVATEGDVMQFTMLARSDASGADLVAEYGARWAGLGLAQVVDEGSTADGTAISYRDAYSSVSIAADSSSGTGTVYTIFGVLRAG